jgi:hypothetical protein
VSAAARPYVLATSCAEPDVEYASLGELAYSLLAIRSRRPGNPDFSIVPAMLTRCELPGGKVLSIRLLDGANGGRGELIGYAFVPNLGHDADDLRARLQRLTAPADDARQLKASA